MGKGKQIPRKNTFIVLSVHCKLNGEIEGAVFLKEQWNEILFNFVH